MRRLIFTAFLAISLLALSAPSPTLAEEPKADEKKAQELPKTDAKAETMLKEAWARVVSVPTLEKDAVEKIYADSQSIVDFSDVPEGYRVSNWAKKAAFGISVDARVAWLQHEEAFSQHVLDGKAAGGSRGGMGIKRAIGGAQIKNGHALPFLMGLRDFDTEFKDHTFTFGEDPDKKWKMITAWFHIKKFRFSKSYYIDKKGKGVISHFTKHKRLFIFKLSKMKRKQVYIEGLTIQPSSALADFEYDPKKKKKKKAKKDDKDETPSDPRLDEKIEWYGFGKRQVVVGKKTEMAISVTTWTTYEKRRVPVTTFLNNAKFNDDVSEAMVKSAGFGKRAGGLPPPTYKGEDKKKAEEAKKKEESKKDEKKEEPKK